MRPKPGTNEPPLVIVKQEGMKVKDIKAILKDSTYNGFPGELNAAVRRGSTIVSFFLLPFLFPAPLVLCGLSCIPLLSNSIVSSFDSLLTVLGNSFSPVP